MFFKNLTLYKVTQFPITADVLAERLAKLAFAPCTDLQPKSVGFIEPHKESSHVYAVNGENLIALRTQKRNLPGSVVKEEVARQAAAYEKEYGHKPGRKMLKELKERAIDELLPQAFKTSRTTRAWLSLKAGLFVIDTASKAIADDMIGALLQAVGEPIKMHPLGTNTAPSTAMSNWLLDTPPEPFTIDSDALFVTTNGGNIKYSNVTIEGENATRALEAGQRPAALALTWDDKVSFVLGGNGSIKRVKPLDILKSEAEATPDADMFANDFVIMAGTLTQMVGQLVESLGGVREQEEDLADMAEADDDLLDKAQKIVIENGRASISLVQRHLRIGYNRAARLLEALQGRGVVSAEDSSTGMRRVLATEEA
jgi:recombination associated protein RdgC